MTEWGREEPTGRRQVLAGVRAAPPLQWWRPGSGDAADRSWDIPRNL